MTNAEARFNKIHIRKVYACLAVTCHLHFWQNDRDFLRATVVTRGWNGYRNKSQHRKSTLEKKILPPFQQGFEPATFQSRVRCSNHWAIPAPSLTRDMILHLYSELAPLAESPPLPPSFRFFPLSYHVVVVLLNQLMSSDIGWHIRDKLRPMPKQGSV